MDSRSDLLGDFAARYIWWRDVMPPSEDRIIAQGMSIGTWGDIRRLERVYSPEELREGMLRVQPGWISEQSWELWRGRLREARAGAIPEAPPRRSFYAEMLEPRLNVLPPAQREIWAHLKPRSRHVLRSLRRHGESRFAFESHFRGAFAAASLRGNGSLSPALSRQPLNEMPEECPATSILIIEFNCY